MKMLGGVGDDGAINLISYVTCLANFMNLQVGSEEQESWAWIQLSAGSMLEPMLSGSIRHGLS
jgi:hypothetical protein